MNHDWLKMTAQERRRHRRRCHNSDMEGGFAIDLIDDLEEALRRLDEATTPSLEDRIRSNQEEARKILDRIDFEDS